MREPNEKHALVRQILLHANAFPWTVATGHLTFILEKDNVVLNVFDERFEQPWTKVHSHFLDFRSEIIAGEMVQIRYERSDRGGEGFEEYGFQELTVANERLGTGTCYLRPGKEERYGAGEGYSITAPEIHQVIPVDGTVTLVTREFKTDPKSVFGFWSLPQEPSKPTIPFGTAAVETTVKEVIGLALKHLGERAPW